MTDLPLAAEFPAASRDQWLELVEGVLKGADFEKKLVCRTYDGLEDPAALSEGRRRR